MTADPHSDLPEHRACVFVPAHEPWSCSTHPGGHRTRLDETRCSVVRRGELREAIDAIADALNGWDQGEPPRPDTHRHWSKIVDAFLSSSPAAPEPPRDGLDAATRIADLGYYRGETFYYDPNVPRTCWLRSDGAGAALPVEDEAVLELLNVLSGRYPVGPRRAGGPVVSAYTRLVATLTPEQIALLDEVERNIRAEADPPKNPWRDRLVKAENDNHCGDAACMTRRISAAIRVLTGGKEHQDYCWAIEAFEVELGVRDPALVGAEPSNAMLDAALASRAAPEPPRDGLDAAEPLRVMGALAHAASRDHPDKDDCIVCVAARPVLARLATHPVEAPHES